MSQLSKTLSEQEKMIRFLEADMQTTLGRTKLTAGQAARVNNDFDAEAQEDNVYAGPAGDCSVQTIRRSDLVLQETAGVAIAEAEDGTDKPQEAARNGEVIEHLRWLHRRVELDTYSTN